MRPLLPWLLLVALLAAPVVVADDDEGDDDDDRKGARDHRKLDLDVDDLKATIKLEREVAGLEDAVKIEFDAEKAKVQIKHEEKDEQNESEQKLEARFLALLEYVDGNGNGAYDVGETIASAWSLGNSEKDAKIPTNGTVDWDDLVITDVASGATPGKKISGRASFGPNATFGLDLFVYGDLTLVGNSSLEPTEAKIDILIQHYPYVRGDSALAAIVDLKAKEEFKSDDEDDDEPGVFSEMSEGNLSFRLTFTWLANATVDGVDRDVRSTLLKDKQEAEDDEIQHKARVALGYPRGDLIVHDPTVGVDYGTASDSTRQVPAPGLLVAVAACALVALGLRRRS